MSDLTLPAPPRSDLAPSWSAVLDIADRWSQSLDLRVRSGEISDTTRTSYVYGFGRFIDWCMDHQVSLVTPQVVQEWKAGLIDAGMKANTINAWLAAVRAFFAWGTGERLLLTNPMSGVKSAGRKGTSKRHKRDALTDREIRRVLGEPDTGTDVGVRDKAIISLMAYTGARSIEIYRADLANLRSEAGRLVLYVTGKGHSEADELVVIAHPAAENALHDWLAVRGQDAGALFTSLSNRSFGERLSLSAIRHIIKAYYRASGVHGETKTTHSLRHTAITNAIRNGAPPQKVRSMARHANLDTTMIYFHEFDRLENPAEAFVDYGE